MTHLFFFRPRSVQFLRLICLGLLITVINPQVNAAPATNLYKQSNGEHYWWIENNTRRWLSNECAQSHINAGLAIALIKYSELEEIPRSDGPCPAISSSNPDPNNPNIATTCTYSKTNSGFTVEWTSAPVHRYVIQRSVNFSAWYHRLGRDQDGSTRYTFQDGPLPNAGDSVRYRVMAKLTNGGSELVPLGNCDFASSSERQSTRRINGRWEIVDNRTGQPVTWEAVNVRTDKLIGNNPSLLSEYDIAAIACRFNSIRLSIHWSDLEPKDNQYNQDLKGKVIQILDWAGNHGIDVILDPVHLGGKDGKFWIPQWVWSAYGYAPGTESKSKSFPILEGSQIQDYLRWIMTSGIGTHKSVVAVEVVNEPHPTESKDAWRSYKQEALMRAYSKMVDKIRQYRPEVIVVLGSYYGGHLFDNDVNPNQIKLVFENTPNLVWTAHNYFTGVEGFDREGPDYDRDGRPDIDGQGFRGVRGAGTWTESFDSAGCYAEYPAQYGSRAPDSCSEQYSKRGEARLGHARNAANHDRVAQEANMPFFMGEFGMGKPRTLEGVRVGWKGVGHFMRDKLSAYRDIHSNGSNRRISWAVWAFDSRVDGGFGLYHGGNNKWHPETSSAFMDRCN